MNAQLKPLEYRELLVGCGSNRNKQVYPKNSDPKFLSLTTVDINPAHKPDFVHDLNILPWPFEDSGFDEVHAYEVLEHLGRQGDAASFFAHFSEIWRVLKPGGQLFASVPMWDSPWAWSDPGHTRIITRQSLIFLSQKEYVQVGKTAISDYRSMYQADFDLVAFEEKEHQLAFILKALK